jgi:phosphatidylglycerophosphatase C
MGDVIRDLDTLLGRIDAAAAAGAPRLAAFDADGTLWRGDIGDEAFIAADDAGLVDDATYRGPLKQWAERWSIALPDDKTLGLARIFDETKVLMDAAKRQSLYEMQSWIYAGHTRAEIGALGERLFSAGFDKEIYPDMQRLIAALKKRDVQCVIVSASHGALVEAGARRFGLDAAAAIGMEPAVDAQNKTLPSMARSTFGHGKVAALRKLHDSDRAPLLCCGDSVLGGDRELLAWSQIPVAVAPREPHRAAALADPRVLVFDPS